MLDHQQPTLDERLQTTLPNSRLEQILLPNCGGLKLALIKADFPTGPLPAETMHAVISQPAYWAFCWGSGLALAQYLLNGSQGDRSKPLAWLRGKTVVDIGSGSGVAGIAAARAGAAAVWACDNDEDALAATAFNANINHVSLELFSDLAQVPAGADVALLADVLYDKSNLPLLQQAQRLAPQVLVADSRINCLPDPAYTEIAQVKALTFPNLGEFDEFGTTRLFTLQGSELAQVLQQP